MGNSLQDELLKAGLVTEEQVEKAREKPKRHAKPPGAKQRKSKGRKRRDATAPVRTPATQEPTTARTPHELRANRLRAQQIAQDSRLSPPSEAELAKRAARRRLAELIDANKVQDPAADKPFHFTRGKRIKRIYVTAEQHRDILAGTLAVVVIEGDHFLLPAPVVPEIVGLAPSAFVFSGSESSSAVTGDGSEDDPYAAYQVPDDLTW